ncbi:HisA/HisF-related TIM barrel protein [Chloroflexota bacterium]
MKNKQEPTFQSSQDPSSPPSSPRAIGGDDKFTIYPAIDLRAGRVVRLFQGDPAKQTVYGNDSAGVARRWLGAGARWLHVVNLDGAFGEPGQANLAALQEILAVVKDFPGAQVQFGGGLRSLADIESALSAGVSRAILGTLAISNPKLAIRALTRFGPQHIGLGVDARQGRAHTHGWQQKSEHGPLELGKTFYENGMRTCVYTNINRDGSGRGVDLQSTLEFARHSGLSVIASGGVAAMDDVRQARLSGLPGLIIGRALYDGAIDLEEAIAC